MSLLILVTKTKNTWFVVPQRRAPSFSGLVSAVSMSNVNIRRLRLYCDGTVQYAQCVGVHMANFICAWRRQGKKYNMLMLNSSSGQRIQIRTSPQSIWRNTVSRRRNNLFCLVVTSGSHYNKACIHKLSAIIRTSLLLSMYKTSFYLLKALEQAFKKRTRI